MRFSIKIVLLICISTTGVDAADKRVESCLVQSRTDLEELFCRVKYQPPGNLLPSLADFRRNSTEMQALLLQRPAQQLGLSLPASGLINVPKTSLPLNGLTVNTPGTGTPRVNTKIIEHVEMQPVTAPHSDEQVNYLSNQCQLNENQISCQRKLFRLVSNLPNSMLTADALGPENRLTIPVQEAGKPLSDYQYLRKAYAIYIEKMLSIGLGAATMSFTRFHQIHHELKDTGADFQHRFAVMFEHLKSDKRSSHAPHQLTRERPACYYQLRFVA